jgi:hypothetical protein
MVASCVWRATPDLVVALDERFGEPLDAYVNGSQVWIREDGPGGALLEWRLHPVAGYRRPPGLPTEEVFASVALALATGSEPPTPLSRLWDGLEAFGVEPDDRIEPQPLAAAATEAITLAPDAVGLVDHEAIAEAWETTRGAISIVAALFEQLRA